MTGASALGVSAALALDLRSSAFSLRMIIRPFACHQIDSAHIAPAITSGRHRTRGLTVAASHAPMLLQHRLAILERECTRIGSACARKQPATAPFAVAHPVSDGGLLVHRELQRRVRDLRSSRGVIAAFILWNRWCERLTHVNVAAAGQKIICAVRLECTFEPDREPHLRRDQRRRHRSTDAPAEDRALPAVRRDVGGSMASCWTYPRIRSHC